MEGADDARLARAGADRFSRRIRADAQEARGLRHAFGAWLGQVGLDADDGAGFVLAVGEAVANAVEHAYARGPGVGAVRVDAGRDTDGVWVEVRDHGSWRPPVVDDTRGRGFLLMRALAADVDVITDERGTTITLRHPCPPRS